MTRPMDEREMMTKLTDAQLKWLRHWLVNKPPLPRDYAEAFLSLIAEVESARTLRSVEPAPMVELEGETPFLQRALGVINTLSSEADDEEIAVKFTAAFTSIRAETIEECAKEIKARQMPGTSDAIQHYNLALGDAEIAIHALRSLSTKGAGKS